MTPFTAALFAAVMGLELELSPLDLGLKLFWIVAGSALLAAIVRKIIGLDTIARRREEIDGLNIMLLFVFVAAIMENVAAKFIAEPWLMTALTAFAFAVFFAVFAVSVLAFIWAHRANALALGFMASQRNMGLMLAATGGAVPKLAWLYFAIAQFPIFLSPYLFTRPVKWILARGAQAERA